MTLESLKGALLWQIQISVQTDYAARREISGIMVDRAIVYSKRMSAKYDIVYAVSIDTVADDF